MSALPGLSVLDGVGHIDEGPAPYLREELDARSLHFSMAAIQSRMDLARPDALTLEYTRTMMGWLLFAPHAKRLAMIGLGGGSLAKFCRRHLPRSTIVAVEIDARVIALRDAFGLPADDARLRIVEADGAQFVRDTDERFEVLLVDAFDAHGLPPALATQRFFDDCADVLGTEGVFVMNLHAADPQLASTLARVQHAFGGEPLRVTDRDGSNTVVLASRGPALRRIATSHATPLTDEPAKELRGAFSRVTDAWQRARSPTRDA